MATIGSARSRRYSREAEPVTGDRSRSPLDPAAMTIRTAVSAQPSSRRPPSFARVPAPARSPSGSIGAAGSNSVERLPCTYRPHDTWHVTLATRNSRRRSSRRRSRPASPGPSRCATVSQTSRPAPTTSDGQGQIERLASASTAAGRGSLALAAMISRRGRRRAGCGHRRRSAGCGPWHGIDRPSVQHAQPCPRGRVDPILLRRSRGVQHRHGGSKIEEAMMGSTDTTGLRREPTGRRGATR